MITPNTIIGGRYRVTRPLGGGGMKLVYLAEDLRLAGRLCALAEMVDSITSAEMQQQAIAGFQREADMLAQLSNEHIPRIFDRFSEANHHYLVMEYVDGITVEDELKQAGGKLEVNRVIGIALQVLDTLDYLHNLSPPVIYRDLKPSNVMLERGDRAKLIDFGIARHFRPLTNATMIGTQGYAPPEQYRGRVETRSDLYALGATMHQALSGRDPALEPPFSFPPLRKLCPDLNPGLAAVVDQALAYDVVNRIASAADFRLRLLQIRADGSGNLNHQAASPTPPGSRPQLKLPLSVGNSSNPTATANPVPLNETAAVPPAASDAAAAPTVLSTAIEIRCPACTRMVPADSRFCSYCAADLQRLGAFQLGAEHDAATAVLGPRSRRSRHRRPPQRIGLRRRRPFRPMLWLFIIFIGAFVIQWLVHLAANPTPPDATGMAAPSGVIPGTASASLAPADSAQRLTNLRAALAANGYTRVSCRMERGTIVIWGTVPTEFDRAMVQRLVFQTTGVLTLRDRLRVRPAYASP